MIGMVCEEAVFNFREEPISANEHHSDKTELQTTKGIDKRQYTEGNTASYTALFAR
jgi:hypothetical protein